MSSYTYLKGGSQEHSSLYRGHYAADMFYFPIFKLVLSIGTVGYCRNVHIILQNKEF